MLQLKLKHIDEGIAFSGRRAKTARSQGKKVQITVKQEISRWMLRLLFFNFHTCYIPRRLHDFDTLINAEYLGTWPGLTCSKN